MADIVLLATPSEGRILAAEVVTGLRDTTYISINCTLLTMLLKALCFSFFF